MQKPDRPIPFARDATKPGDLMFKLMHGNDLISKVIKVLSDDSNYVHGGIAVGNNKICEVSGGITMKKLVANIYIDDLMTELKHTKYEVWRCDDQELAFRVALEAYPFSENGRKRSRMTDYSLRTAIKSTGKILGDIHVNNDPRDGAQLQAFLDQNESVLSVANMQKKKFFCTQFMAWMYYMTAAKMGYNPPDQFVPINSRDALPSKLAAALERSQHFRYMGQIEAV